MKITLLAATLSLAAAGATARADVNLIDNNQKVTVDCAKDKTVNITGNKAAVTLNGTCDAVNISGNKATVKGSARHVQISGNDSEFALDAADHIMVSGNNNAITYKRATAKDKKTGVMDSGENNKISLKK